MSLRPGNLGNVWRIVPADRKGVNCTAENTADKRRENRWIGHSWIAASQR
jgi:hypothetical protein